MRQVALFGEAQAKLKDAFAHIKEIRLEQEQRAAPELLADAPALTRIISGLRWTSSSTPTWPSDRTCRSPAPRLGPKTIPSRTSNPITSLQAPIELAPPTVADDVRFS